MARLTAAEIVYVPLTEADEIRLIELQPRPTSHEVTCTIHHVRLLERPEYEALSYMWGNSSPLKFVQIDGNTHHIRENLWSALSHLRLEDEPRFLWIDAICINQRDTTERNHQVDQMRRIYNQARGVVVWLGLPDPTSVLAFQLLEVTGEDSVWTRFSRASIIDGEATVTGNLDSFAFKGLCSRSYWHRLWIIQEVIHASDIILQCGDNLISWNNLWLFLTLVTKRLHSNTGLLELVDDRESILLSIEQSVPARLLRDRKSHLNRGVGNGENIRTLAELCQEYGECLCEDPRDKVFGLHSFAVECCRVAVTVNYSLTWSEVCRSLLEHELVEHRGAMFVAQRFHKSMGVTTENPVPCIPAGSPHRVLGTESWLTSLTGNVRGRIMFISSPLSALDTANARKSLDLPKLSTWSNYQLEHIASFRAGNASHHSHITSEVDLVCSLGDTDSSVNIPRDPKFPNKPSGHLSMLQKSLRLVPRISDTGALFHQLLEDAWKTVEGTESQNCRLGIEENGLICFVPNNVQPLDLVCQFLSSDIMVIVRRTQNEWRLIGRAINFTAALSTEPFRVGGLKMDYWHDVKDCCASFSLDFPTLRLLTRASANTYKV